MEKISISEIAQKIISIWPENEILKARLATATDVSKFYNVPLSVAEVAKLHPSSTDGKILIRASDALLLNLNNLKHERRTNGGAVVKPIPAHQPKVSKQRGVIVRNRIDARV